MDANDLKRTPRPTSVNLGVRIIALEGEIEQLKADKALLLEALKAVTSMHCRNGHYEDRIGAMEQARASIAKAKGGSQ